MVGIAVTTGTVVGIAVTTGTVVGIAVTTGTVAGITGAVVNCLAVTSQEIKLLYSLRSRLVVYKFYCFLFCKFTLLFMNTLTCSFHNEVERGNRKMFAKFEKIHRYRLKKQTKH